MQLSSFNLEQWQRETLKTLHHYCTTCVSERAQTILCLGGIVLGCGFIICSSLLSGMSSVTLLPSFQLEMTCEHGACLVREIEEMVMG